jgi:hypothetical protein
MRNVTPVTMAIIVVITRGLNLYIVVGFEDTKVIIRNFIAKKVDLV